MHFSHLLISFRAHEQPVILTPRSQPASQPAHASALSSRSVICQPRVLVPSAAGLASGELSPGQSGEAAAARAASLPGVGPRKHRMHMKRWGSGWRPHRQVASLWRCPQAECEGRRRVILLGGGGVRGVVKGILFRDLLDVGGRMGLTCYLLGGGNS